MQNITFSLCEVLISSRYLSTSIRINYFGNNHCYKNVSNVHLPMHHASRNIFLTRTANMGVGERTRERITKLTKKQNKNLVEKFMKEKGKKKDKIVYEIWPNITVNELAKVLKIDPEDVYDIVLSSGEGDSVNNMNTPIVDRGIFKHISKVLDCQFTNKSKTVTEKIENKDVIRTPISYNDLVPRPPVIALVGHIDHGKTTLLDRLRASSVVQTECGGITQHIGAFSLNLGENRKMTFLDTPGHAAFKSMRVRGTNITDIVILVVDAVEGPLEQTLESLRAIRQSKCNMIVAINKIDRPEANVQKTKDALQAHGVQFEENGGNVPCVSISALHGTNIDELIETVIVQSEVLQLTGDPKGPVEGTIVESSIEHGLGGIATVLLKRGTLRKGTCLVCGTSYAKVKSLLDTSAALEKVNRKELQFAMPAEGCKVAGWKGVPQVGGEVLEVEDEKRAKEVVQWRVNEQESEKTKIDLQEIEKKREIDRTQYVEIRRKKLESGMMRAKFGWLDAHSRTKETDQDVDEKPKVKIMIKFDVDGSKDAILSCLDTYEDEEVILDIIYADVGDINQEDVEFASNFEVLHIQNHALRIWGISNLPFLIANTLYYQLNFRGFCIRSTREFLVIFKKLPVTSMLLFENTM